MIRLTIASPGPTPAEIMCNGIRYLPEPAPPGSPPSPATWYSEVNKDRTTREDKPHG